MKNNQLALMLVGVLFLSSLATVVLTYGYISSQNKMRRLQPQISRGSFDRNFIQSLVNDCLEYSKHNKDIMPLIQSIQPAAAKAAQAVPGAVKPAGN